MPRPLSRRAFIGYSAAALAIAKSRAFAQAASATGLKDVYPFKIGTAIPTRLMENMPADYAALVASEFNAITLENAMKWELIHPKASKWNFEVADKFVEFAERHNMYAVGHVLVWHSQVPDWVFRGKRRAPVSRMQLIGRMEDFISTVAGRYQGKIAAWDVVNEAVDEDKGLRLSPWLRGIGDDYMKFAFRFAHEADPKAKLIYNDYNMHNPAKRAFVVNFVRDFQKSGVPIHGIGMQGHVGLEYPEIEEFEASLKAYGETGAKVHITEFDLDVLPVAWEFTGAEISTEFKYSDKLNPYPNGLPDAVQQQLTDRYVQFFKLFLKYQDVIERVTFWGTGDSESWKNDFPVKGRTNYPLLFDRNYQPKPAYHAVKELPGR